MLTKASADHQTVLATNVAEAVDKALRIATTKHAQKVVQTAGGLHVAWVYLRGLTRSASVIAGAYA